MISAFPVVHDPSPLLVRTRLVGFALLAIQLTGCGAYGPGMIRNMRPEYNLALAQTGDQELLLNIVRMKYRDPVYFLNVERVAVSMEVLRGASAGAGVTVPLSGPTPNVASGTLGPFAFSYNEKPTFFYAPLEGERFARQMMTPVSLDTILLLSHSGWSVERVFLMTVEQVNGVRNAPTASGPTPSSAPEFNEFMTGVKALRSLQERGKMRLARVQEGTTVALELKIAKDALQDSDTNLFRDTFGLARDKDAYRILAGVGTGDTGTLAMTTRSLSATMSYLAQSVVPPPKDMEQGRVTRTLTKNGQPFDWHEMLGDLMTIHSGSSAPENASVVVHYRGSWFWIDDSDLISKSTFSLMNQLFAVQAGQIAGPGPAFTFSTR